MAWTFPILLWWETCRRTLLSYSYNWKLHDRCHIWRRKRSLFGRTWFHHVLLRGLWSFPLFSQNWIVQPYIHNTNSTYEHEHVHACITSHASTSIKSSYFVIVQATSNNVTKRDNSCLFFIPGDNVSYTMEGGNTVIVRGGSDPTKCLEILHSFLQSADDDTCYPKPCAIGQIYQPSLGTDTFFAISAYVYTPITLKAIDHFNRLQIQTLNTSAHNYCRMVGYFTSELFTFSRLK